MMLSAYTKEWVHVLFQHCNCLIWHWLSVKLSEAKLFHQLNCVFKSGSCYSRAKSRLDSRLETTHGLVTPSLLLAGTPNQENTDTGWVIKPELKTGTSTRGNNHRCKVSVATLVSSLYYRKHFQPWTEVNNKSRTGSRRHPVSSRNWDNWQILWRDTNTRTRRHA